MTHYVRSGDFVVALIRESQDLNEYAFALGALAHYAADNNGHRLGTNVAVPVLYPDLRREFGKTVTYWDNPLSHVRTEFGFDVLQVAQGRYANDQFRKFIGFKVSKPVLERAFLDTYGLEMKDVFKSLDLALGTYRYSTSTIIPGMTKVAWELKKDTFIKEIPGITKKKFLYNLSRSSYEKDFGKMYQRPGFKTRLVSWFLRIVPKSGPFKGLAFKAPDAGSGKDVYGQLQRHCRQLPRPAGGCGGGPSRTGDQREHRHRRADRRREVPGGRSGLRQALGQARGAQVYGRLGGSPQQHAGLL